MLMRENQPSIMAEINGGQIWLGGISYPGGGLPQSVAAAFSLNLRTSSAGGYHNKALMALACAAESSRLAKQRSWRRRRRCGLACRGNTELIRRRIGVMRGARGKRLAWQR